MLAAKVTPKNRMATYDWPPRMKKSLQLWQSEPRVSRKFSQAFAMSKRYFMKAKFQVWKVSFNEHRFLSSSRFRRLVKLEKPMLVLFQPKSQESNIPPEKSSYLGWLSMRVVAKVLWFVGQYSHLATPDMHGEQPILTLDLQMFFLWDMRCCEKKDAKYRHDQHDSHCSPLMESVLGWCF